MEKRRCLRRARLKMSFSHLILHIDHPEVKAILSKAPYLGNGPLALDYFDGAQPQLGVWLRVGLVRSISTTVNPAFALVKRVWIFGGRHGHCLFLVLVLLPNGPAGQDHTRE